MARPLCFRKISLVAVGGGAGSLGDHCGDWDLASDIGSENGGGEEDIQIRTSEGLDDWLHVSEGAHCGFCFEKLS